MQSSRSDKVMVVQSAEANGNMLLGIIDIMHIFHKIIGAPAINMTLVSTTY